MSNINETLQNAYNEHGNMYFGGAVVTVRENGKKFVKIVSEEEANARELSNEKPYFFMKQELEKDITKENYMKKLHHAVYIQNGNLYDYITGHEYESIDDWADVCNGTTDDVMYGTNHTWRKSISVAVPLSQLLDWLDEQNYVQASHDEEEEFQQCKKHGCCAAIRPDAWVYRGTKQLAAENKLEFDEGDGKRHVREDEDEDYNPEEDEDEDEEDDYADMPSLVSVNVTVQKENQNFNVPGFTKLCILVLNVALLYNLYNHWKNSEYNRGRMFLTASL
jgi:hypothetical protein